MTLLRPPLAFSRFDAEDCYMIDHRPSGRIFLWIGHLTSFRHRLLTLIISKVDLGHFLTKDIYVPFCTLWLLFGNQVRSMNCDMKISKG